jgi:ElaB/YqjD/DUF883 family membrane-anchored ribosome-binding protein
LSKQKTEARDTQEIIKALRKDVDKRLTDLKREMDDVQQKAAKAVAEQPLLALGVAFVVGMAVGIALSNIGD